MLGKRPGLHGGPLSAMSIERGVKWTLPYYLLWGLVWFAFFMFALHVRVESTLWEPVFLWVFAQTYLLESVAGDLGRPATLGVAAAGYAIMGCLLWAAVEIRKRQRTGRALTRSGIAWAILFFSSMIVAVMALS